MPRKSRSTTTLAPDTDPEPATPALPDTPETPATDGQPEGAVSWPEVRLEMVDPTLLRPNPRNPRISAEEVADMVASFGQVGVLQPLVVFPVPDDASNPAISDSTSGDSEGPDGQDGPVPLYQILIGHRRHRAAVTAQLPVVPCLVTTSEEAGRQIVTMVHENREREGLTLQEEAAAYQQLTLLDWTPEMIAEQVTRPVVQVQQTLALQSLPAQARDRAVSAYERGDMDLEQIAALEEFADDPKALERITDRSGWGFRHAVAEEQAKRRRREAGERLKAELTVQGVRLISKPRYWGSSVFDGPETEASALLDKQGQPLDAETAKKLPGFAAFVDTGDASRDPQVVVVCRDPEEWGYTRLRDALRDGSYPLTRPGAAVVGIEPADREFAESEGSDGAADTGEVTEQTGQSERDEQAERAARAAEEAMRREVEAAEYAAYEEDARRDKARRAARSEAFDVARPVRHEFLNRTWGTARTAKKVFVDALRVVVAGMPESYDEDLDALYERIAGASPEDATTAGIDRLTRMVVAWWLTQCEEALQLEIDEARWNRDPATTLAHLDRLVEAGYQLSDIEQSLHDSLTAECAPATSEDPTDDADDAAEGQADEQTDGETDDQVTADGDSSDASTDTDTEIQMTTDSEAIAV